MKRDLEETTQEQSQQQSDTVEGNGVVEGEEEESDDEVGPALPSALDADAPLKKRRKVILNTKKFEQHLPQLDRYARSFMHRENLCSVDVTTQTNFLMTTSEDGFVKFWKKQSRGIEFVKQYRAHTSAITSTSASGDGTLYATACALEKTVKAFDVVNFDLFTMLPLAYEPKAICWVSRRGQGEALLAVSDAESPTIRVYDMRRDADPLYTFHDIHSSPVHILAYNHKYHCVVSCDVMGNVEYWAPNPEHTKPEGLWTMKSSTHLYDFRKSKSLPSCITMSPDCDTFATLSYPDREVRLFRFKTGKIVRKYDESLATLEEMHRTKTLVVAMDDMEFGRRLAIERDLEKSPAAIQSTNVIFDESGVFILYPTMLGVKVINTNSNVCLKVYGKGDERLRCLNISLYQGAPKKVAPTTLAMAASDNPLLKESLQRDPILFCTAFNKDRFYLFTSHELSDSKADRDVFNERPKQGALDSSSQQQQARVALIGSRAVLHTSAGDIELRLFPDHAPKAVENFVTLAKRGYYDATIFHRIIKQFMIQGGDPEGTGTGGESMWQHPFEDECTPHLKHDTYVLSMANAGPNTNGSQFFITTTETHHLDGKHTVFGRVLKGFDVVHAIENAPVGKLDRPRDPVHIHSITIS